MNACLIPPIISAAVLLSGCAADRGLEIAMTMMRVSYTDATITLDGRLDEPAWSTAPVYAMGLTTAQAEAGLSPHEGGAVRLLWDADYLYVGAELIDSDVVQEDDRDQQHHYQSGDVLEVFLAPVQDGGAVTFYWEFYATPHGKKTAFFYPGRGRLTLPSNLDYASGLRVAAHVQGTLNDWRDRDHGWSAELAIPRRELAEQGVALEPGQPWRILFGRYNYSAYLPDLELTMCPALPAASFHTHEHWAGLSLEPEGGGMSDPARKVALAFLAHPDDAEILCGGTLIRLREEHGYQVHIATATPGDCGSANLPSDEIAAVRREEAKQAAALIGATYHCLEARDVDVIFDHQTNRKAIDLFRVIHPTLVFTHPRFDYMLDHEQVHLLARSAAFSFPIPNASALPLPPGAHVPHLYYVDPLEGRDPYTGQMVTPTTTVDISRVIDRKAEMLACHASQRDWLRSHHGMDEYLDAMKRHAARRGEAIGVAHAEAFTQHRGHAFPQDDLLDTLLSNGNYSHP